MCWSCCSVSDDDGISESRQAFEDAEFAPGTAATLRAFRNRPTTPLDAVLELPRDKWQECEFRSQRCNWRLFKDDPRSSPPFVEKSQGFVLVVHIVRPLCEGSDAWRSGASHQIGTDDSSPKGWRACKALWQEKSSEERQPRELRSNVHCRQDQDASALHMHFKL